MDFLNSLKPIAIPASANFADMLLGDKTVTDLKSNPELEKRNDNFLNRLGLRTADINTLTNTSPGINNNNNNNNIQPSGIVNNNNNNSNINKSTKSVPNGNGTPVFPFPFPTNNNGISSFPPMLDPILMAQIAAMVPQPPPGIFMPNGQNSEDKQKILTQLNSVNDKLSQFNELSEVNRKNSTKFLDTASMKLQILLKLLQSACELTTTRSEESMKPREIKQNMNNIHCPSTTDTEVAINEQLDSIIQQNTYKAI